MYNNCVWMTSLYIVMRTLPATYVYGIYRHAHSARNVRIWDLSSRALCPPRTYMGFIVTHQAMEWFYEIQNHRLDARYHGNGIYIYLSYVVLGHRPIYAGCKIDKMAALCVAVACDSNTRCGQLQTRRKWSETKRTLQPLTQARIQASDEGIAPTNLPPRSRISQDPKRRSQQITPLYNAHRNVTKKNAQQHNRCWGFWESLFAWLIYDKIMWFVTLLNYNIQLSLASALASTYHSYKQALGPFQHLQCMLCSPTQITACHQHLQLAQACPHDAVSICLVI